MAEQAPRYCYGVSIITKTVVDGLNGDADDETRKAEAARKAEEARRVEDKRKAEEATRKEEARRAEEEATRKDQTPWNNPGILH